MKKLIFVTIILLISIFLVVKTQNGGALNFLQTTSKPQVTIDGHTFKVEVAKTDQDKQVGLTKYNSLDQDSGMYFPFGQEGVYPFWMKNMKFPIDIVFIDKGKIIYIEKNAPAANDSTNPIPTYAPQQPSDSVLEIYSGLSDKYGFKTGDSVTTSGI